MAINYSSFQVQAPRTNQQGILAFSQAMQQKRARDRYGIASSADMALDAHNKSLVLRDQLAKAEQDAAQGDMKAVEAAHQIRQQLVNITSAQNQQLEKSGLGGIASMENPMEREMALKQAMAQSPDYLKQKQSNQAMGSRKSYAPIPVQIEKRDANGNIVKDKKTGLPVMQTAYQTFEYDPKTSSWKTGLLDGLGNPIQYEKEKAYARERGAARGKVVGDVEGKVETFEEMRDYEVGIKSAVAAAIEQAKAKGESIVRAEDLKSGLPQIQKVVNELAELSEIATYTTSGRIFDAAVREIGLEPTEGATARAKYEAIINNQTLPMLRRLLGAAFTEKEGERVGALLGNPNYSPKEKQAQLEAYLNQYLSEIEAAERRSGIAPQQTQPTNNQPAPTGVKFLGFE